MSDRIDPLAPWFESNTQESKILVPRREAALTLQTRQVTARIFRISAGGFSNYGFITQSPNLMQNSGALSGQAGYALVELEAGWVLNQIKLAYAVKPGSTFSLGFTRVNSLPPVGTGISIGPTTIDNAWHIDTKNWTGSITAGNRIVQDGFPYMLDVSMAPAGGSTGGEINVGWVELQFTQPQL